MRNSSFCASTLLFGSALLAVFVVVLLFGSVFFVLIFRIFYLQAIGSQNLQLRAVEQWTRMLPLTAKRGDIVDVNGNILATSTTTYDVYVRAKEIKYPTLVAGFLAEKLGLDYEKVLQLKLLFVSSHEKKKIFHHLYCFAIQIN